AFLIQIDGEPSITARTVHEQAENRRSRSAQARLILVQRAWVGYADEHANPDLIPIEHRPVPATDSPEEVADEVSGIQTVRCNHERPAFYHLVLCLFDE